MQLSSPEQLIMQFYRAKEREAKQRVNEIAGSDSGTWWFMDPYPNVPTEVKQFASKIIGHEVMERLRQYHLERR